MEEIKIYRSGRVLWSGIIVSFIVVIPLSIMFCNIEKIEVACGIIIGFVTSDLFLLYMIRNLKRNPCMIITDKSVKMMFSRCYEFDFDDVKSIEMRPERRSKDIVIYFREEKTHKIGYKNDFFTANLLSEKPETILSLLNERLENSRKRMNRSID